MRKHRVRCGGHPDTYRIKFFGRSDRLVEAKMGVRGVGIRHAGWSAILCRRTVMERKTERVGLMVMWANSISGMVS